MREDEVVNEVKEVIDNVKNLIKSVPHKAVIEVVATMYSQIGKCTGDKRH